MGINNLYDQMSRASSSILNDDNVLSMAREIESMKAEYINNIIMLIIRHAKLNNVPCNVTMMPYDIKWSPNDKNVMVTVIDMNKLPMPLLNIISNYMTLIERSTA